MDDYADMNKSRMKQEFENIATNGLHQAILKDGIVFDNLRPNGINYSDWINDLGGKFYTTPPQALVTSIKF